MNIPFTKMQALGNDFVVIDAIQNEFTLLPAQIQKLGNRHFGIGFDQLMVLEKSQHDKTDFNCRIFNADGSQAEQCGNGLRCLARFAQQRYFPERSRLKLSTTNRVVEAFMEGENVRIQMGVPEFEPWKIPFLALKRQSVYDISVNLTGSILKDQAAYRIGALSMGNPHAVMKVSSLKNVAVELIGHAISTHSDFPNQVNVGFMEIMDSSHIQLRVYERGVGETMACGSGACAAVAVGRLWGELDASVEVELPGGKLAVTWPSFDSLLELTGSAEFVFSGSMDSSYLE